MVIEEFPRSSKRFYWRIPVLALASIIASIPFYGFFVHASTDSQQTAVLLVLCWFLTWVFAIGSVVIAVIQPPTVQSIQLASILMILYLVVAGVIGWWGVENAIGELLAG